MTLRKTTHYCSTGRPVPSGCPGRRMSGAHRYSERITGKHQRTRRNTRRPIDTGCSTHRMSGAHRFSEGKTTEDLQKYRIAVRHRMSDSPDVRCLTDVRYVSPSTLQFTEFTSQAPDVRWRPDVRCMDRMSGLDRMSVTYAGKLPQRL